MSEFNLRLAASQDLRRVVEFKLAMFEESGHASLLAAGALEVILNDYESLYARAEAQHFVACVGSALVACAGAFLKSDVPFRYFKNPIHGFVGDVYTRPQYRRKGLAKSLNEMALDWLQSRGITMVRLLASEAGRPLYESLGFVNSDEMYRVSGT